MHHRLPSKIPSRDTGWLWRVSVDRGCIFSGLMRFVTSGKHMNLSWSVHLNLQGARESQSELERGTSRGIVGFRFGFYVRVR